MWDWLDGDLYDLGKIGTWWVRGVILVPDQGHDLAYAGRFFFHFFSSRVWFLTAPWLLFHYFSALSWADGGEEFFLTYR